MTLRQSIWMFAILTALAGCDRPSDAVGQNAQPETATEGSSDGASSTPALDRIRERLETPDPDDMIVIAHRACWHEGPENSIAAIRACIDMGVEVIEIDVHRSRDGVLVVLHDESVDRMTNGSGRVDALSAAEIGALRLRAGAGGEQAALTDHRIPTLREVFEATRGETVFNLDTKGEVILDTIALVREMGVARQALFKTALPPTDPVVKAMDLPEGSYFMPVVRESAGSLADHVASFAWADPIAFEVVFQTSAYIEEGAAAVTDAGYRLWVNTLWEGLAASFTDQAAVGDPDANWGALVDLGVSMIQTDEPLALIEYLKKRGLR